MVKVKMDRSLVFLIQLLTSFTIFGTFCNSFACKSPEQFDTECLSVFYEYRLSGLFWENICSDSGRTIFACLTTQYDGYCDGTAEQDKTALEDLFKNFEMSIDYACEYQTVLKCRTVSECFPRSIYSFTGSTAYSFYNYFCGDPYLQFMFICARNLAPDCPASVEVWRNAFQFSTLSGLIAFNVLDTTVTLECEKLLGSDVECIRVKNIDIASCQIAPTIDVPQGSIVCEQSSQSEECVIGKCGSTVATFYKEMYNFLQCGQNVDGGWGEWGDWGACSLSCAGGTKVRTRACDSPTPTAGGKECDGTYVEVQGCNEKDCPARACVKVIDTYGVWKETLIGLSSTLQCQKTSEVGTYIRRCDANGLWGPVTGQCDIKPEILDELNSQLRNLPESSDVSQEIEDIAKNLTGLTDSFDSTTSGTSIKNILETTDLLVDAVESNRLTTETGNQHFFELMSNLIEPKTETVWNTETGVGGSDVIKLVDRYLSVIQENGCDARQSGEISAYDNTNLYTEQGKVRGDVSYPKLKKRDAYIEISADTLFKKGLTDICFGGSSYTAVGRIVNSYVSVDGTTKGFMKGQEINSEVVSVQLQKIPGVTYDNLDPPVRVTLKPKNTTLSRPICVFWNYSITDFGGNGAWSSAGCNVVSASIESVICECFHLTNFAILMSTADITGTHSEILSIISAVGCAISMVCLVLTIVVHAMVWKLVKSDRAIILMNLCVALLLALAVFLTGVSRTESQEACAAIAAIIQLMFLAVFFFMLLIGIEILICVVHVFVTKFRIKILLPVAWLAPVVIVGVSLGVTKGEGYGNDRFCWLEIESGVIWSFIGPAAFIILVNFIIVAIVFKKMASSAVLKSKSTTMKVQTGIRSLCVLLPMMGLTWVFGLFSVNSSFVFFQYVFSICNTLQGLFIFLFHCVLNRQVREAIKRRRDRKKSLQTFSSDFRKQSRSITKDCSPKSPISDPGSSDSAKRGVDNKAFVKREKRASSVDTVASYREKIERKPFHKQIKREYKIGY